MEASIIQTLASVCKHSEAQASSDMQVLCWLDLKLVKNQSEQQKKVQMRQAKSVYKIKILEA